MQNSDHRPCLTVSRHEAKKRIESQIDKADSVPNVSVNSNDEARRWYEYTAELLRQLFTTDELADEFTGLSSIGGSDEISTGYFLKKLISIYERVDLYTEDIESIPMQPTNPIKKIETLLHRYHAVVKQIQHRHESRPTLLVSDEYDGQDLLHGLLKIFFDDVRPEEWTPSYAGGSSRMDFLLKAEKIVIEVKKTRSRLQDKEIGTQLADDVMRYRSHPDCRTLMCFVYDPDEQIQNPKGLEHDLGQSFGELEVRLYILQR